MTTRVYGIPNCDTVKKTRRWLDENGVEYEFHDYKKFGISRDTLEKWCEEHGFEALINKRCLLYTSPSPRDGLLSRMPSSA